MKMDGEHFGYREVFGAAAVTKMVVRRSTIKDHLATISLFRVGNSVTGVLLLCNPTWTV